MILKKQTVCYSFVEFSRAFIEKIWLDFVLLLEGQFNDQYPPSQRNNYTTTRYGNRGGYGYRGGSNRYNNNSNEYYEEN